MTPTHHCLEADAPSGEAVSSVLDALIGRDGAGRIRCPLCRWQPRSTDVWFCSKCERGLWNTFDTRGVCPVCAYRWEWTACLSCHRWSLHEAWYESPTSSD